MGVILSCAEQVRKNRSRTRRIPYDRFAVVSCSLRYFLDETVDPEFEPSEEYAGKKLRKYSRDIEKQKTSRKEPIRVEGAESAEKENEECIICFEPMEIPIKFSCQHEFCLTCAKSIARTSKVCAVCRGPIPDRFVMYPEMFTSKNIQAPTAKHSWFYRNHSGWWAYTPKMQIEIETAFRNGESSLSYFFNGRMCFIHFDQLIQSFGCNVQEIKRSSSKCDHFGVAGLRYEFMDKIYKPNGGKKKKLRVYYTVQSRCMA